MGRWILASIFLLASNSSFSFEKEIVFPELTGRVVDNANLIDEQTEAALSLSLEEHENATTNQVVVVTLDNLQGRVIEDFGYRLGNAWGIGQKENNNGVILLVAQQERKVRIEVGYGLEGQLTDAIAAHIIQSVIVPKFKQAKFNEGIEQGTYAIVQALGNQYEMSSVTPQKEGLPWWMIPVGIFLLPFLSGGRVSGGRSSSEFSGGGGRFGGGGATGGW